MDETLHLQWPLALCLFLLLEISALMGLHHSYHEIVGMLGTIVASTGSANSWNARSKLGPSSNIGPRFPLTCQFCFHISYLKPFTVRAKFIKHNEHKLQNKDKIELYFLSQ